MSEFHCEEARELKKKPRILNPFSMLTEMATRAGAIEKFYPEIALEESERTKCTRNSAK